MRKIDRQTIELAANGDVSAFEDIYRAFSSAVYTIAIGITRDRGDAEEAAQDVFLKVHRNLKSFRFGSSLGTWIYKITVNAAVNVYRRRRRNKILETVDSGSIENTIADTGDFPGDTYDKRLAVERAGKILDKLSPEHRSCVILREIEGLDYKDMANVLGVPLGTVRSRLKRAREAMAALAAKEGINHEL
jgi:RNA polymerase sigma-70 factor (ECF subfamily)